MSIEERLARLEEQFHAIADNQDQIKAQIKVLMDTQIDLQFLVKWVVFPLILGAFSLVGIKLILPNG